jgi:hypothetical protein
MNRLKRLFAAVLLAGGAFSAACGNPSDATGKAADAKTVSLTETAEKAAPKDAMPDKVTVYYFHGTRRCPTCLGIQKTVEQTIEDTFGEALDAGMLAFESLNFEEEKNRHFVEKYQLSFSTMIVTAEAKGKVVKWENAGKIWDFAHTPDKLASYVEENVRAYLKLLGAG